jgi:hypothetical protein
MEPRQGVVFFQDALGRSVELPFILCRDPRVRLFVSYHATRESSPAKSGSVFL